jgi:DNA-binding NarL/FixJ family response regulator
MLTDTLRVFLVDDHPIVLAALTGAMDPLAGVEVVGTAGSAEEAAATLSDDALAVDVAIVDVSLPGESGIDLCRRLADMRPALRCIVLSAADDVANARRALSAGAAGYLVKDISMDSLVAAVRAAASGQFFVDPRVARNLLAGPRATDVASLSPADREVLRLVADGLSNAEIGSAIHAAPSTVKARVSRLLTKLGARTRAEAVAIAVRNGAL